MGTQTIILKNSEILGHTVINYPDGQNSVCLDLSKLNIKDLVDIKCNIKNASDLEILNCLICALKRHDFVIERLIFIYLYGLRSDRAFNAGEPNFVKDILSPIIKSWDISEIYVFAPHSPLSMHHLGTNADYWRDDYSLNFPAIIKNKHILFADKNSKYIFASLGRTELMSFLGAFEKHRNAGKILVTFDDMAEKKIKNIPATDPIIIVDDLCDAGGTFISEAEYLRANEINNPLYLFVAHGLFTKGLHELTKHFKHIFTTNSYTTIEHPQLIVINMF